MSPSGPADQPSGRYPHLVPAGRAPGPQSRRATRRRGWGAILITLSAAPLLVGAVAILVTGDPSQRKTVLLAALLAVLALPLLALAVWLWRRPHNRQADFLELRLDRTELRRGDRVTAAIGVRNGTRIEGTLQVGLVCSEFWDKQIHTTDSNGNQITSRSTQRAELLADWHDLDARAPQGSVAFTVPSDAPFSYEGDTVSWAWRVSVRVQTPHRSDPHREVALWVSP